LQRQIYILSECQDAFSSSAIYSNARTTAAGQFFIYLIWIQIRIQFVKLIPKISNYGKLKICL
jgi:hypothetical protein